MPFLSKSAIRSGCVKRMYSLYGVPYFGERNGIGMAHVLPTASRPQGRFSTSAPTFPVMTPLAVLATASR